MEIKISTSNDFQTVMMIATFFSIVLTLLSSYMNYYVKNETLLNVTISLLYYVIAFLVIDTIFGLFKMII